MSWWHRLVAPLLVLLVFMFVVLALAKRTCFKQADCRIGGTSLVMPLQSSDVTIVTSEVKRVLQVKFSSTAAAVRMESGRTGQFL